LPVARPNAERRLALLEAVEELAGVGSWDWTPDGAELLWSDNLFRIFGLEPGEIVPTLEYAFAAVHPDDRDRVVAQTNRMGESGELRPLDFRIVLPGKGVRYLRATLVVAEKGAGRPHRLLGWVKDVTELRRSDSEIAAHHAVVEALTEWESLESGAELLIARMAEAMDFVAGVFWVPEGDVLVSRVVWRKGPVALPDYETITDGSRLPRGAGLAGQAWEARRLVSSPREESRARMAIPAIEAGEVLAVLELVSRDQPELTERLVRSLTDIGYELGQFLAHRRAELTAPVLTPRELQVLQLAAQGLSASAIARHLVVSTSTVRTHLENIYPKLGVSDKAAAVAKGLRDGLIH
jgi:DNA-binding CsgD family transcriptional regulator